MDVRGFLETSPIILGNAMRNTISRSETGYAFVEHLSSG